MRLASDEDTFTYDAVAYPTAVLAVLTPDRIRAAGILHGWDAPPVETASVLEIGCGDGLNLMGMAAVTPKGRFVGFDLSSNAIERGRGLVEAAGLANVDLHPGNILDYSRDGETFDYIVTNGVYAWTPLPVRAALLDLIAARLAPGGVAFCSYDCLPAAASKVALNRFLTAGAPSDLPFERRLHETGRLIALLSRHQAASSRLKPQIDYLVENLPRFDPGYLFHDFLAEFYNPSSLADFAAAAGNVGLDVVGDAGLVDLMVANLDDEAKGMVEALGPDWVGRGSLIDMLRGSNMFRRSLLVRRDARPPARTDLAGLRFSSIATRSDEDGRVRYEAGDAVAVIDATDADACVLDALIAAYPGEMSREEVLDAIDLPTDLVDGALRTVACWQLADAYSTPQPFVTVPGERPLIGQLVRTMMAHSEMAITLRHLKMVSNQAPTQYFLQLCDGTRTRDDLVRDLSARFGNGIGHDRVEAALSDLARRRLFVA